ncbi:MAG: hypothetical protein IPI35_20335 [Deltaproteobacteria bacterium]|nr:hypothetical protein [Deltaproteobacteria bacterium]
MTWPAINHLDEVIIGGGELGGWLWRYWWHFTELEAIAASDLSFTDRVLTFLSLGRYPETGNILDVLFVSFPLSLIWDLPPTTTSRCSSSSWWTASAATPWGDP